MPVDLPPMDIPEPPAQHAPYTVGPALNVSFAPSAKTTWSEYTVTSGDTLWDIAAKHDTTVNTLLSHNALPQGGKWLMPGQTAKVPSSPGASSSTSAKTPTAPSASSATGSTTITVRQGDTLSGIAAKHGTTVSTLTRLNGINVAGLIYPGQKLKVTGSVTASAPQPSAPSAPSSATASTPPNSSGPWTVDNIGDYKLNEDVNNTFLNYTYSSATARSAAANREHLASIPVPDAEETQQIIVATARDHGVDPALMLALASQESGWNQRAVSPANAIGVMQVIPTSGDWASGLVGRELNLLNPHDNVTAGTVIIRALLRTADTEDEAIGGYYQGLGSVQRDGLYSDTKQYVKNIQALRSRM